MVVLVVLNLLDEQKERRKQKEWRERTPTLFLLIQEVQYCTTIGSVLLGSFQYYRFSTWICSVFGSVQYYRFSHPRGSVLLLG